MHGDAQIRLFSRSCDDHIDCQAAEQNGGAARLTEPAAAVSLTTQRGLVGGPAGTYRERVGEALGVLLRPAHHLQGDLRLLR